MKSFKDYFLSRNHQETTLFSLLCENIQHTSTPIPGGWPFIRGLTIQLKRETKLCKHLVKLAIFKLKVGIPSLLMCQNNYVIVTT